ncbi:MAG: 16S rRNA (uracil(1498)-N(3))-methyltransferase [Candidatus Omnitrophica bacterium]|nr:16S rRNA (uracil(1498)-N(3))-methyltransferase [Candidatus Omnitrophota bacterium]
MSRFYAPPENINGNFIHINGQEAKHILKVMRLAEDDKVVVFDGTGREYAGFIKEIRPSGGINTKSVIIEIVSTKTPKEDKFPEITLAQCVPKREKMDYIVEKTTELGVSAIIPLVSERTVVDISGKKAADKRARWERIAVEAAKQCGRTDVPEIKNVQKLSCAQGGASDYDLALMACLREDTLQIRDAISGFTGGKIIVFIGPEGDFTPGEIKTAEETNCRLISLGKRVLKSDTAPIYAISVLNHEFSR